MKNTAEKNKIWEMLGLENLPEEMQMDLLAKMGDSLYPTIITMVVEKLGPGKQGALGKFLESKPEFPEFLDWCGKNVPEFENLVKDETRRYLTQLSALESKSEG